MRKLYGIQYRGRDTCPGLIRAAYAHEAAAYAVELGGLEADEGNLSVDTPAGARMFFDILGDGTVHLRSLRTAGGQFRNFSQA